MEKVQYVYHWNRIFGAIAALAFLLITLSYTVYSLVATEKSKEPAESPFISSQQETTLQDESQTSISENPWLVIENQQPSDSSNMLNSSPSSKQKSDNPSFDFAQFQPTASEENTMPVIAAEDESPPTATESTDPFSMSNNIPSSLQQPDIPSYELEPFQITLPEDNSVPVIELEEESPPSVADIMQSSSISREPIETALLEPDTDQLFLSDNPESTPQQAHESTASLNQSEATPTYTLQDSDNNKTFHLLEIQKYSPSVKRFTLARSITDKEPVGTLDSITMDSNGVAIVYAFSEIVGMKDQRLNYYWYHEDERVAKVPIRIGNNRWRINSSKYINDKMQGAWSVELQTDDGQVLAGAKFFTDAQ